jgi:hypothetical protein
MSEHQVPAFTDHELALIEGISRLEVRFLTDLESRGFTASSAHLNKLSVIAAKARMILESRQQQVPPDQMAAPKFPTVPKEKKA